MHIVKQTASQNDTVLTTEYSNGRVVIKGPGAKLHIKFTNGDEEVHNYPGAEDYMVYRLHDTPDNVQNTFLYELIDEDGPHEQVEGRVTYIYRCVDADTLEPTGYELIRVEFTLGDRAGKISYSSTAANGDRIEIVQNYDGQRVYGRWRNGGLNDQGRKIWIEVETRETNPGGVELYTANDDTGKPKYSIVENDTIKSTTYFQKVDGYEAETTIKLDKKTGRTVEIKPDGSRSGWPKAITVDDSKSKSGSSSSSSSTSSLERPATKPTPKPTSTPDISLSADQVPEQPLADLPGTQPDPSDPTRVVSKTSIESVIDETNSFYDPPAAAAPLVPKTKVNKLLGPPPVRQNPLFPEVSFDNPMFQDPGQNVPVPDALNSKATGGTTVVDPNNGRETTTFRDGSVKIKYKSGTVEVHSPDKSPTGDPMRLTVFDRNGVPREYKLNISNINPDTNQRVTIYTADTADKITAPGPMMKTTHPNGTVEWKSLSGGKMEEFPNGNYRVSDGNMVVEVDFEADTRTTTKLTNGRPTQITTEYLKTNVKVNVYPEESTVEEIFPDGSTKVTETLPNKTRVVTNTNPKATGNTPIKTKVATSSVGKTVTKTFRSGRIYTEWPDGAQTIRFPKQSDGSGGYSITNRPNGDVKIEYDSGVIEYRYPIDNKTTIGYPNGDLYSVQLDPETGIVTVTTPDGNTLSGNVADQSILQQLVDVVNPDDATLVQTVDLRKVDIKTLFDSLTQPEVKISSPPASPAATVAWSDEVPLLPKTTQPADLPSRPVKFPPTVKTTPPTPSDSTPSTPAGSKPPTPPPSPEELSRAARLKRWMSQHEIASWKKFTSKFSRKKSKVGPSPFKGTTPTSETPLPGDPKVTTKTYTGGVKITSPTSETPKEAWAEIPLDDSVSTGATPSSGKGTTPSTGKIGSVRKVPVFEVTDTPLPGSPSPAAQRVQRGTLTQQDWPGGIKMTDFKPEGEPIQTTLPTHFEAETSFTTQTPSVASESTIDLGSALPKPTGRSYSPRPTSRTSTVQFSTGDTVVSESNGTITIEPVSRPHGLASIPDGEQIASRLSKVVTEDVRVLPDNSVLYTSETGQTLDTPAGMRIQKRTVSGVKTTRTNAGVTIREIPGSATEPARMNVLVPTGEKTSTFQLDRVTIVKNANGKTIRVVLPDTGKTPASTPGASPEMPRASRATVDLDATGIKTAPKGVKYFVAKNVDGTIQIIYTDENGTILSDIPGSANQTPDVSPGGSKTSLTSLARGTTSSTEGSGIFPYTEKGGTLPDLTQNYPKKPLGDTVVRPANEKVPLLHQRDSNGNLRYIYEDGSTQTFYSDGSFQIIPNDRFVEKIIISKDGTKVYFYKNKSKRTVLTNGNEEDEFPDGTKRQYRPGEYTEEAKPDGTKVLKIKGTNLEQHNKPDGTIELIDQNGRKTQITPEGEVKTVTPLQSEPSSSGLSSSSSSSSSNFEVQRLVSTDDDVSATVIDKTTSKPVRTESQTSIDELTAGLDETTPDDKVTPTVDGLPVEDPAKSVVNAKSPTPLTASEVNKKSGEASHTFGTGNSEDYISQRTHSVTSDDLLSDDGGETAKRDQFGKLVFHDAGDDGSSSDGSSSTSTSTDTVDNIILGENDDQTANRGFVQYDIERLPAGQGYDIIKFPNQPVKIEIIPGKKLSIGTTPIKAKKFIADDGSYRIEYTTGRKSYHFGKNQQYVRTIEPRHHQAVLAGDQGQAPQPLSETYDPRTGGLRKIYYDGSIRIEYDTGAVEIFYGNLKDTGIKGGVVHEYYDFIPKPLASDTTAIPRTYKFVSFHEIDIPAGKPPTGVIGEQYPPNLSNNFKGDLTLYRDVNNKTRSIDIFRQYDLNTQNLRVDGNNRFVWHLDGDGNETITTGLRMREVLHQPRDVTGRTSFVPDLTKPYIKYSNINPDGTITRTTNVYRDGRIAAQEIIKPSYSTDTYVSSVERTPDGKLHEWLETWDDYNTKYKTVTPDTVFWSGPQDDAGANFGADASARNVTFHSDGDARVFSYRDGTVVRTVPDEFTETMSPAGAMPANAPTWAKESWTQNARINSGGTSVTQLDPLSPEITEYVDGTRVTHFATGVSSVETRGIATTYTTPRGAIITVTEVEPGKFEISNTAARKTQTTKVTVERPAILKAKNTQFEYEFARNQYEVPSVMIPRREPTTSRTWTDDTTGWKHTYKEWVGQRTTVTLAENETTGGTNYTFKNNVTKQSYQVIRHGSGSSTHDQGAISAAFDLTGDGVFTDKTIYVTPEGNMRFTLVSNDDTVTGHYEKATDTFVQKSRKNRTVTRSSPTSLEVRDSAAGTTTNTSMNGTTAVKTTDGTQIVRYPDGKRLTRFTNGTREITYPDTTVITEIPGDLIQDPEIPFKTQVKYPGGLIQESSFYSTKTVTVFSNGIEETYHQNGLVELKFPADTDFPKGLSAMRTPGGDVIGETEALDRSLTVGDIESLNPLDEVRRTVVAGLRTGASVDPTTSGETIRPWRPKYDPRLGRPIRPTAPKTMPEMILDYDVIDKKYQTGKIIRSSSVITPERVIFGYDFKIINDKTTPGDALVSVKPNGEAVVFGKDSKVTFRYADGTTRVAKITTDPTIAMAASTDVVADLAGAYAGVVVPVLVTIIVGLSSDQSGKEIAINTGVALGIFTATIAAEAVIPGAGEVLATATAVAAIGYSFYEIVKSNESPSSSSSNPRSVIIPLYNPLVNVSFGVLAGHIKSKSIQQNIAYGKYYKGLPYSRGDTTALARTAWNAYTVLNKDKFKLKGFLDSMKWSTRNPDTSYNLDWYLATILDSDFGTSWPATTTTDYYGYIKATKNTKDLNSTVTTQLDFNTFNNYQNLPANKVKNASYPYSRIRGVLTYRGWTGKNALITTNAGPETMKSLWNYAPSVNIECKDYTSDTSKGTYVRVRIPIGQTETEKNAAIATHPSLQPTPYLPSYGGKNDFFGVYPATKSVPASFTIQTNVDLGDNWPHFPPVDATGKLSVANSRGPALRVYFNFSGISNDDDHILFAGLLANLQSVYTNQNVYKLATIIMNTSNVYTSSKGHPVYNINIHRLLDPAGTYSLTPKYTPPTISPTLTNRFSLTKFDNTGEFTTWQKSLANRYAPGVTTDAINWANTNYYNTIQKDPVYNQIGNAINNGWTGQEMILQHINKHGDSDKKLPHPAYVLAPGSIWITSNSNNNFNSMKLYNMNKKGNITFREGPDNTTLIGVDSDNFANKTANLTYKGGFAENVRTDTSVPNYVEAYTDNLYTFSINISNNYIGKKIGQIIKLPDNNGLRFINANGEGFQITGLPQDMSSQSWVSYHTKYGQYLQFTDPKYNRNKQMTRDGQGFVSRIKIKKITKDANNGSYFGTAEFIKYLTTMGPVVDVQTGNGLSILKTYIEYNNNVPMNYVVCASVASLLYSKYDNLLPAQLADVLINSAVIRKDAQNRTVYSLNLTTALNYVNKPIQTAVL